MLDYIIVGFGLGGASTAFRLEEMNRKFVIFEDSSVNSSKVAGGVMNPVILKRFTLAWNADEQLKESKQFYRKLEFHLKTNFLSSIELYRKFFSVEEQNDWFNAADKPGLAPFLDTNLRNHVADALPADYSFGKVVGTARVDTRKMLDSYAEYLESNGQLRKSRFAYNDLEVFEDYIQYRGIRAKNVIFAEGFGVLKNPFFNYLPIPGNKGEYIIIEAPGLDLDVTVKASIFISPLGNNCYKIGATYNNKDKTVGTTAEARQELVSKLEKLITVPFRVVDQVVGIRPSTIDRRPVVGRHPEHQNMYCCNGFGSRGVLTAPAASAELLALIEEGKEISVEMDLARFTRKHYPKA
ncbi:NAD(P)/FAD-dependent oxidoreductase [Salinimicrobium sp. GXAS 041]|uniref:NAD(P)/FAD-dependent oxidoreductase n=1 Tax=Salinimicrobium sp. GXAS 041 TaxID=3400806 RepID=UPI003C78D3D3